MINKSVAVAAPNATKKTASMVIIRATKQAFVQNLLNKIVCSIFILFIATSVYAQDIITLKNGEEIKALVQEIGLNEVKYKKFDNQNGPNYTLKKDEVFMIKYANGSKDMFKEKAKPQDAPKTSTNTENIRKKELTEQIAQQKRPELLSTRGFSKKVFNSVGTKLSKTEVRSIMAKEPNALQYYNTGISFRSYHQAFLWTGVGIICAGIGVMIANASDEYMKNDHTGRDLMLIGFACIIPSTIFYWMSHAKIATSVNIYNSAVLDKFNRQQVSLNFGITHSGSVGLTLNF